MITLPQLAGLLQTVLTTQAHRAGRQSGFIRRRGKLDAATWTQALVFGWLARPDATLAYLAQTAATCGAPVSPQALDQRFHPPRRRLPAPRPAGRRRPQGRRRRRRRAAAAAL